MATVSLTVSDDPQARRAFTMHSRQWQSNRYVYPVVSRRSKGISIGVNLNPDKICNFDCIYCSVERHGRLEPQEPDLAVVRAELAHMLDMIASGEIYHFDPFSKIPEGLRRVNDIAFSGDGEPTTFRNFGAACRVAAQVRDDRHLTGVKLVVITNATMFHRPSVQEAFQFLDAHGGEIWAKLDAGTAAYYELIDRTVVPFQRVLENLLECCRARPTVIQSLFMRVYNDPPGDAEWDAYIGRLRHILEQSGRIKLVQLYTVARQTTEAYATPLSHAELSVARDRVIAALPELAVEVYA